MDRAVFRIFAGNKYVDIQIDAEEPLTMEKLLDIQDGEDLMSSIFLRKPRSDYPDEIRCFLSAMHDIQVVASDAPDGYVKYRHGEPAALQVVDDVIEITLTEELAKNPKDHRRSLAGNLSILYAYALYLFEKQHGIISYHSSALVDEEKKYIYVTGGDASSGKSVLMLEMMAYAYKHEKKNLRVLSTEMGHISVKDAMVAYTGAKTDNVALFPGEHEKVALMKMLFPNDVLPDPDDKTVTTRGTDGSVKTPVSVSDYFATQPEYSSADGYQMVYLMPTIKMGNPVQDPVIVTPSEELFESLVKVAQQKLGKKLPNWLYTETVSLPVEYFAQEEQMEKDTIAKTLKPPYLKAVIEIQGDPVEFNKNPGAYWEKIESVLD